MNNMSTNVQVWFMRHGKTPFNYENSPYDKFMDMLCNGHETPLAKEDPGIDFKSLPKRIDLICHSPLKRAIQTAEMLRNNAKWLEESELLREVRFDWDIISPQEYASLGGLVGNRRNILERWYDGKNEAEKFEDSLARVKEIESFLSERQEKKIVLITHGWFLRLLEIYFVKGKHTDITLEDILNVTPVPHGHCINNGPVTLKFRGELWNLAGDDFLAVPLSHNLYGDRLKFDLARKQEQTF